jgi:hypothetical protein
MPSLERASRSPAVMPSTTVSKGIPRCVVFIAVLVKFAGPLMANKAVAQSRGVPCQCAPHQKSAGAEVGRPGMPRDSAQPVFWPDRGVGIAGCELRYALNRHRRVRGRCEA